MSAWLHIVGVTEQGVAALGPEARGWLDAAEIVIGVQRRLEGVDDRGKELIAWNGSLEEMVGRIMQASHKQTVLLASGDPNWFGIAATLARRLPPDQFDIHPVPSSFQFAAARLHWPMQNVTTLSLHGRPVEALHPHIVPGNRILALTSDASTLDAVADMLVARGYGSSQLTVLENLGGSGERMAGWVAEAETDRTVGDFYVLAIDCVANVGAELLAPVPGLPDHAFVSDGQLTKREVRAATLAKLAPYPGALLWDVGAGCGSVAIEWKRAARNARAIAFESEPDRVQMILSNKIALGVPGLQVIEGHAPDTLAGQTAPDAVFLGGNVEADALFQACWQALKPGGRLVANAVTIGAEQALYQRHKQYGGEIARIEVSVLDHVGAHRALRPRMAVTQWLAIKENAQ